MYSTEYIHIYIYIYISISEILKPQNCNRESVSPEVNFFAYIVVCVSRQRKFCNWPSFITTASFITLHLLLAQHNKYKQLQWCIWTQIYNKMHSIAFSDAFLQPQNQVGQVVSRWFRIIKCTFFIILTFPMSGHLHIFLEAWSWNFCPPNHSPPRWI